MTSVSAGKIGPVGGITRSSGDGRGSATGQALGTIAADVAARITGELNLAVDPDGRGGKPGALRDLYGIDDIAARLAEQLGASPFEAGEINRVLNLFAAEVAARIAAIPDSGSIEEVAALLARRATEANDPRSAISLIERATSDLAA